MSYYCGTRVIEDLSAQTFIEAVRMLPKKISENALILRNVVREDILRDLILS